MRVRLVSVVVDYLDTVIRNTLAKKVLRCVAIPNINNFKI